MKNNNGNRKKPDIKAFSLLAEQIIEMIEDDSENSVRNIVWGISWNDTIYRTFNEGVRLSWQYGYQGDLPGSLIEYIHGVHISFVVMSLRKIYERKQPDKKSVNSIPSLYNIIAESADLFTRENYVCRDGFPYTERPEDDASTWRTNATVKHRRTMFDRFCGIDNSDNRARNDRIPVAVLEKLKEGNVLNKDIEVFANKFLAHASSENNRPNEQVAYGSLKLSTIDNQIKRAIWGIQQIGKLIDHLVLKTVVTPLFDPIQNWCGSIFNERIEPKLRAYWDKRTEWWEKWFNHYWMGEGLYISPRRSI